jgi:Cap4 dsDNA endonuclease
VAEPTGAAGNEGPPSAELVPVFSDLDVGRLDPTALVHIRPRDIAGPDTFRRYRYQAKQVFAAWLQCLLPDGPIAVICEHVEDYVVVFDDTIRFRQVKTRNKGVWTVGKISKDGGGLDSLIRSYLTVQEAGMLDIATFELLLEGVSSERSETVLFFTNPENAPESTKRKICEYGLPSTSLPEFLSRLRVLPGMSSQSTIDAVNVNALAGVLTNQPLGVIRRIYRELLVKVEAAQAEEVDLFSTDWADSVRNADALAGQASALSFGSKLLTRQQLLQILPPIPQENLAQMQAAVSLLAAPGTVISQLERKLISAGATEATLDKAKTLRALADVQLELAAAANAEAIGQIDRLADDVLTFARATATNVALTSAGNPVMIARQGDAVFAQLATQVTQLRALDTAQLLCNEPYGVLGYLCHLSDKCYYSWKEES